MSVAVVSQTVPNALAALQVQEELHSLAKGITGVPHFIINGKYHLSGAQEPDTFQQIFAKLRSLQGSRSEDGS